MKIKKELLEAKRLLETGKGNKILGLDIRVAKGLEGKAPYNSGWEWVGFYQAVLWVLDYEGIEASNDKAE